MTARSILARACAIALCTGTPFGASAQDVSRIVAATIYVDGAVVERQLKTPGGTRHIEMNCMPPGVDASTLQIDGDASVRLGDLRSEPLAGDEAQACARGPLDPRIRALEDQKAALDAQSRSDDIALDYLRRWNGSGAEPATARAPNAAGAGRTGPVADGLRKSALDLMTDQARLKHLSADVDRQLAALQKSTRHAVHAGSWTTLRFDISTAAAATLRVRYHVPDAHWHLGYRAALDTATSTLHLDRQAEITQGSGEDWTDVALSLSMDRNEQQGGFGAPDSWDLQLRKNPTRPVSTPTDNYAGSSNNNNAYQRVEITGSYIKYQGVAKPTRETTGGETTGSPPLDRSPVLGMGVDERAWETLFHASQPVSMPSDNQTHTLALDAHSLPVQLSLESQPQQDPHVYLVARTTRPAGIWPPGSLQLWRDGSLIDRDDEWAPPREDELALAFGRDERVSIAVERPASMKVAAGFFGSDSQVTWGTVFVITNRHTTPQKLHLFDASPVSHDEALKVESKFDPMPGETAWRHRPGVNAWTFALAPNQAQRISVSQTVTFPKDSSVTNLPNLH